MAAIAKKEYKINKRKGFTCCQKATVYLIPTARYITSCRSEPLHRLQPHPLHRVLHRVLQLGLPVHGGPLSVVRRVPGRLVHLCVAPVLPHGLQGQPDGAVAFGHAADAGHQRGHGGRLGQHQSAARADESLSDDARRQAILS